MSETVLFFVGLGIGWVLNKRSPAQENAHISWRLHDLSMSFEEIRAHKEQILQEIKKITGVAWIAPQDAHNKKTKVLVENYRHYSTLMEQRQLLIDKGWKPPEPPTEQ